MHCHMCGVITELLKIHNTEKVVFENHKTAKVIFDFSDRLIAIEANAVRYCDGLLEIRDIKSGKWYAIDYHNDVVACTIGSIYSLTHETLDMQCIYTTVDYDGKEYNCRMVYTTDVNISPEDKEPANILIAPCSLNEAIEANADFDCEVDEEVYFFTEDKNLNLPYKELCECLIKEGID